MEKLRILIAGFLGIAVIAGLGSCQSDEDNDFQSYNLGKIYMSQATVISNEVNYNYEIPAPIGSEEIRYTIDEKSNTLKIKLGIRHDGEDALAYEVAVTPDVTNSELFASTLANGIVLDSKYYTLPSKVNVSEGHKGAEFFLDIDLNKLTADYSRNVDNKFVLSVRISESSEYEINTDRSHVMVIIEGRTFIEESEDVLIYMSKAGRYHVPLEDNTVNYEYAETDLSLKVPLDIERNNVEPYDGFSISVMADEDYANAQAVSISNSVVIPAEYYTLPSTDVTFGNNEFNKSFDVAVDFKRLSLERPELKDKKLLIGMKLANPTSSYIIDEERHQTLLIIDAKKFYYIEEVEPGNMLRGAKFNFGDMIHWTAVNSDGGAGAGTGLKPQMASIRDGSLKFTITGRCYHSFYQAVEVTEPGRYKISFEYNHNPVSTGVDGRTFIYFSQKQPQTDVTFYNSADNYCASISGAVVNTLADNISLNSSLFYKPTTKGWDSSGEGILNITTVGIYYFVIGVDIWTAGQGFNATYDNIWLEKVD